MKDQQLSVLTGKKILILSPQAWGKMFLSKHHYAIELAKAGNDIYFLNPPDDSLTESIVISESKEINGLKIIQHKLFFPYNLKFHVMPVFHFFMKKQVKKILRAMGKPPDIIWSFDLGCLYPFSMFPDKSLKIFHPVDEPSTKTAIDSGKGAQIVFSVTREILEKYAWLNVHCIFINHGVSELFLLHESVDKASLNHKIHIGFSGNLLRKDIDRPILLEIIRQNKDLQFDFWGSYRKAEANVSGEDNDPETTDFIRALQQSANVNLHGAVKHEELAKQLHLADAFLICYDVEKDQSKGTNYHKIMEYMSTGKVIISNNVTTYHGQTALIQMVPERDSNLTLPALFKKITDNLVEYNSNHLQEIRKDFAANNTYSMQIRHIDRALFPFYQ